MNTKSEQIVFLDRDGVINRRRIGGYVKSWEEFEFLPGVLGALKRLTDSGHKVILVTNQSGIGRGLMRYEDLEAVHKEMKRCIEEAGGKVEKICFCPHHPDDGCSCRKPQPGLLLQAARECDIDLANCFFVGDSSTDIEAGNRVGCKTIKLEMQPATSSDVKAVPRYRAKNLSQAVEIILSDC